MRGVNRYGQQLTPEEIAAGKHRDFIGGLWDEIGALQLNFMQAQGLLPHHRLLDIGCGALRGGLYFVNYLDVSRYYGLDINASLIEAGEMELKQAGLDGKQPHLAVNDRFDASTFGVKFDFAIAVSLFTHLYANQIVRCLIEAKRVLTPAGKFYASFFEAPASGHLPEIRHTPGEIITRYDTDPFHYSLAEFQFLAGIAGLTMESIGDWEHPRDQKMLCFRRPG